MANEMSWNVVMECSDDQCIVPKKAGQRVEHVKNSPWENSVQSQKCAYQKYKENIVE